MAKGRHKKGKLKVMGAHLGHKGGHKGKGRHKRGGKKR